MNEKWKKQPAVIQRGEKKLADVVYGQLSEHKKDMMDYHAMHATPYYCTSMKGDPYGYNTGDIQEHTSADPGDS